MVAGGSFRAVYPLGRLFHPGRGMERQGLRQGNGRHQRGMVDEKCQDSEGGIPGDGNAVQPGQIQRRGMGRSIRESGREADPKLQPGRPERFQTCRGGMLPSLL